MESPTDLPKTQVKRIVKAKLADIYSNNETHKRNASISKDALSAFAECGRVFISHVTAAANDVCRDLKRNTVTGDDVLQAMRSIQLEEFCDALHFHLEGQSTGSLFKRVRDAEFRAEMKEKNRKKAENRQLREAAKEKESEAAAKVPEAEEVDAAMEDPTEKQDA